MILLPSAYIVQCQEKSTHNEAQLIFYQLREYLLSSRVQINIWVMLRDIFDSVTNLIAICYYFKWQFLEVLKRIKKKNNTKTKT